jgi:acyl-coenzyme A thioesterase PaaI-like protein
LKARCAKKDAFEGVVLNCGRRVGTAEGRIMDAGGGLLAHGTTTCLIFDA